MSSSLMCSGLMPLTISARSRGFLAARSRIVPSISTVASLRALSSCSTAAVVFQPRKRARSVSTIAFTASHWAAVLMLNVELSPGHHLCRVRRGSVDPAEG